jgi:glutathione S-transferase
MTVRTLVIGNKNYSSWSLRPWLLLKHFGVDFDEVRLSLDTPSFQQQIGQWSPTGRVPVLIDRGTVVWDSLAIAEYVNEACLGGRGWPGVLVERARARCVVAEMHAGFAALRSELPMNVRRVPAPVSMSGDARRDVARVHRIWEECIARSGGPWLFGEFSIADAFYAPVVLRFHSYAVDQQGLPFDYCARMIVHPGLQQWCREALAEVEVIAADER